MTARASTVPSASPFSKSPSISAIWLVTWAKHSTALPSCRGEGVEGRGLHLDREQTSGRHGVDRLLCLAKRRIGGPGGATLDSDAKMDKGPGDRLHQHRIGLAELCRRQVVVAGALVPQGSLDQDEVGRRAQLGEAPCRGHADEQPAARREQLLGHQHGKRRADCAADKTELQVRHRLTR